MTPFALYTRPVVTDLTVCFFAPTIAPSTCAPDLGTWHRIDKELYLHTSQQSAWLYVALASEGNLGAEDLLVTDIRVGEPAPNLGSAPLWESRPGGIWVVRRKFSDNIDRAVTEVDVLFGADAVDPRPRWTIIRSPLHLDGQAEAPLARLSVLQGRALPNPNTPAALRVNDDGEFKIVQISDTHMVTGVGVCKDAIDGTGKNMPESEADPLTVQFIGKILDVEKPDLVVLTGDQLHHDTSDSQTALFKAVAPIIERSIPFAAVFGNHDSEGVNALSREYSLCKLRTGAYRLLFLLTLSQAQHKCHYCKVYLLIYASQAQNRSTA